MSSISELFSIMLEIITFPIQAATYIKTSLESILLSLDNLVIINVITPYVANIRYVMGDYIFVALITLAIIGVTIGMVKAFYTLVKMILDSGLISKSTKIFDIFS